MKQQLTFRNQILSIDLGNRTEQPEIVSRLYNSNNQELDEIIFNGGILSLPGNYFEGLDHSEIVLVLDNLIKSGVDPNRIVIINIDFHHDLYYRVETPGEGISLNDWVEHVVRLGMCNGMDRKDQSCGAGVFWLSRTLYSEGMYLGNVNKDLPTGVEYLEPFWSFYNQRCKVSITNLDVKHLLNGYLKKMLLQLKQMGYYVVSSLDLDFGMIKDTQEGLVDETPFLNLSINPELIECLQISDAKCIFQSPGFTDPIWIMKQTHTLRSHLTHILEP